MRLGRGRFFLFFGLVLAVPRPGPAQELQRYYAYHPMSVMSLGKGTALHNPGGEYKRCIEGKAEPLETGAVLTTVEASLVTNSSQLKEKLKLDAELDASFPGFKASANYSYSYQGLFKGHSVVVVITAYTEFGRRSLTAGSKLTAEAQRLIDNGQMGEFAALCGTHYVSTERRGASVSSIVTISGASSDEKEEVSASMAAEGGWGPLTARASASYQKMLSRASQSGRAQLQVVATGGQGFAGLESTFSALAAGESAIEGMKKGLGDYLKQFNVENSAPIGFHVSSMKHYGFDPTAVNLWSELKADYLPEIVEEYRRFEFLAESAKNMASLTDPRYKLLSEEQTSRLAELRIGYRGHMALLAQVHQACQNAKAADARDACRLPEEPEGLEFLPDIPAPANGYFLVVATAADGNERELDGVTSRAILFDRPLLENQRLLDGTGLLEAARTAYSPDVVGVKLVFRVTGDALTTAALRCTGIGGSAVVGLVPSTSLWDIDVQSAIVDDGRIKSSALFLGGLLANWTRSQPPQEGDRYHLVVRDQLGREVPVVVAVAGEEGRLSWVQ